MMEAIGTERRTSVPCVFLYQVWVLVDLQILVGSYGNDVL